MTTNIMLPEPVIAFKNLLDSAVMGMPYAHETRIEVQIEFVFEGGEALFSVVNKTDNFAFVFDSNGQLLYCVNFE